MNRSSGSAELRLKNTAVEKSKFKINMNMWFSYSETRTYVHMYFFTVKPVYNDHPLKPKFVAVVDWWSLFSGGLVL